MSDSAWATEAWLPGTLSGASSGAVWVVLTRIIPRFGSLDCAERVPSFIPVDPHSYEAGCAAVETKAGVPRPPSLGSKPLCFFSSGIAAGHPGLPHQDMLCLLRAQFKCLGTLCDPSGAAFL